MRSLTLTLAALLLGSCSALGLGSNLDAQATAQNHVNVVQMAAENESYLAADTTKAESLKAVQRDRNKAAVELAARMAGTR